MAVLSRLNVSRKTVNTLMGGDGSRPFSLFMDISIERLKELAEKWAADHYWDQNEGINEIPAFVDWVVEQLNSPQG